MKKPSIAPMNFSAINLVPSQRDIGKRISPTEEMNKNSIKEIKYSMSAKIPVIKTRIAQRYPLIKMPRLMLNPLPAALSVYVTQLPATIVAALRAAAGATVL